MAQFATFEEESDLEDDNLPALEEVSWEYWLIDCARVPLVTTHQLLSFMESPSNRPFEHGQQVRYHYFIGYHIIVKLLLADSAKEFSKSCKYYSAVH